MMPLYNFLKKYNVIITELIIPILTIAYNNNVKVIIELTIINFLLKYIFK